MKFLVILIVLFFVNTSRAEISSGLKSLALRIIGLTAKQVKIHTVETTQLTHRMGKLLTAQLTAEQKTTLVNAGDKLTEIVFNSFNHEIPLNSLKTLIEIPINVDVLLRTRLPGKSAHYSVPYTLNGSIRVIVDNVDAFLQLETKSQENLIKNLIKQGHSPGGKLRFLDTD